MNGNSLRSALLPLLVAAGAPAPAPFQGGSESRDVKASMDRYRDYLSRKPHHDWSFDKLVEAAVARNELKDLVARYEKDREGDPDNRSVKIVLARLYARADRVDDALALARSIVPADPPMRRLLGELQLRRNDPKAAIDELDKATASDDAKFLQEVHRSRGKAYLALGDRAAAARAFRAIAELEAASFHTRLEVATLLAAHGLFDEASAEFTEARRLAGDDASKQCRVLAELGKVQEMRLKIEDALATYGEALTLMGRGNWLKKDLQGRILAIHKRGGGLDGYVKTLREAAAKDPLDLDGREFLAQALEEANRLDDARTVLEGAVKDFPEDLKLSRRFLSLLAKLKDKDALVSEYQRILGRHPEEVELYLELGKVFAEDRRLEQAKVQWEKHFRSKIKDPEACARLADLYAFYGMENEAAAMHEKAIELQPRELRHYADFCAFLESKGKRDRALEVAARADDAAAGNASSLEQVSQIWRELGEPAKGRRAIEAAIALRPNDHRLLTALADLQYELGERDAAAASLRQVIDGAPETNVRTAAVDRLVREARKANAVAALAAAARQEIASGATQRSPYLVLGQIAAQERDFATAVAQYEALLAIDATLEEPRRQLARLYEDQGDFELALRQYQLLVDALPQARRQYLKEMARIHLALYDQDQAFALYEEILKASPDNAAAFKEVADAYQKLGLHEKAAECLRQAIRLKPDEGKYHLELASVYRRLDEPGKAREEIVAAMFTSDEEVRNTAQKRYYEFLAGLGQVDEEIARLRKRIEENPYDADSPILLTDLYVRELEYQLALDMLNGLLTYRPDEPRLLEQRARILGFLDRHGDAIGDYEALLKLPKADRDALTLKIAEAAIEAGDVDRAQEVSGAMRDAEKIAALYRKHGLLDPAVAALERSTSQNPRNPKAWRKLADLYKQRGEREKAVECLERVLAILGDDWKVVQAIGQVRFELGDKEGALECGRRLFSAIQLDPDETEEEDGGSRGRSYDPYGDETWRYQQDRTATLAKLADSIQNYFVSKGFGKEFGDLIGNEVEAQPRNPTLLSLAVQHLVGTDKNYARALELVDAVSAKTIGAGRLPANTTLREWQASLDSHRRSIYFESKKDADARIEEWSARLQAESRPGTAPLDDSTVLLLCDLLKAQNKETEARALLTEAAARAPRSARLAAALAQMHFAVKDYTAAERAFRSLLTLLPVDGQEEEWTALGERAFRQSRNDILRALPAAVRKRATVADLRRIHDVQRARPLWIATGADGFLSEEAVRAYWARCLHKLDRDAEARDVLRPVKPRNDLDHQTQLFLGNVYFELEFFDEAAACFERIREIEAAFDADPLFAFVKPAESAARQADIRLARIAEKRGRILDAYDLLRSGGNAAAGELLLTQHDMLETARVEYGKRLDAAKEALARDPTDARRIAYRDAGIKLAEILQIQKQWNEAIRVYQAIAEDLPDAFDVRNAVAALQERMELYDEAVATRFAVIERKRQLNRAAVRETKPEPRTIQPALPPRARGTGDDWVWQNLGSSWYSRSNVLRYPVHDEYVAILRNYLDRKKISKAAEVLRDLAREDVNTFRWMAWNLARLVDNFNFGAEGIPILRLLYSIDSEDSDIWGPYARALVAANQIEEAHRILTKIVNKPDLHDYYRQEAQEQLTGIEARLGVQRANGIADLRAEVEKDPRNVKLRTRLARKLMRERDHAAALEEARKIEALAPHLDETKKLLGDCLKACGEYDGLRAFYTKQVQTAASTEEAFRYGVSLADLEYASGNVKEADAALDSAVKKAKSRGEHYSASAWYLERGLFDRALSVFESEMATLGNERWLVEQSRTKQQNMKLMSGDLPGALDLAYKALEEAKSLGERERAFRGFVGFLRAFPDPESARDRVAAAAQAVGGVKGAIYRAASELACGDDVRGEAALAEVLDLDKGALYLYPLRISLARGRNDFQRALELLDEVGLVNSGSESSMIYTSAGSISERDTFRAERGSLLYKLGRKDEAIQLWDSIADTSVPGSLLVVASIYEEHELYDRAIDAIRKYIDKQGEREAHVLHRLAEIHMRKNDFDEAISLYKRAEILQARNTDYWNPSGTALFDAYLRAGRLVHYLEEQKALAAGDASDVDARKRIASVATLLRDDASAIEALEWLSRKPGFEAMALPALADRQQAVGDFRGAIETLGKIAGGGVNRWSRDELHTRIAMLCWTLGDVEEAERALRRGFDDPESLESLRKLGTFYVRIGRFDKAVESFEKGRKLEPFDPEFDSALRNAYAELGRDADALEAAFRTYRRWEVASTFANPDYEILRLAAAVKEDERIAAGLAANPVDDELLFRAGLLALYRRQFDEAIGRFASLAAVRPRDWRAAAGLWAALVGSKRTSEAERQGERLIELLECESRGEGAAADIASSIHDALAQLHLREGNLDKAVATWTAPNFQRLRRVEPWTYSFYNWPHVSSYAGRLLSRRLYKEALAAFGVNSMRNRNTDWLAPQYAAALYGAGETERAWNLLWRAVVDPIALGGDGSEASFGYGFSPYGPYGADSSAEGVLLRIAAETGTLVKLEERLSNLRTLRPDNRRLLAFWKTLLARQERYGELLALVRSDLDKAPNDDNLLRELVTLLRKLGRFEEAIPIAEARFVRQRATVGEQTYTAIRSSSGRGSGIRFGWAGGSGSRGSSTFWSSTSNWMGDFSVACELMALYAKVGRAADAARIETEIRNLAVTYSHRTPALLMGQWYSDLDLPADAERLYDEAVHADPKLEGMVMQRLFDLARRLQLPDLQARAAARALASIDERARRNPHDPNLPLERGRLLLENGGPFAEVASIAEGVLERSPDRSDALLLLAWARLRQGDATAARDLFQRADHEFALLGREFEPSTCYGLGLTLAKLGERDEARRWLRRALFLEPQSPNAAEAKSLVE